MLSLIKWILVNLIFTAAELRALCSRDVTSALRIPSLIINELIVFPFSCSVIHVDLENTVKYTQDFTLSTPTQLEWIDPCLICRYTTMRPADF